MRSSIAALFSVLQFAAPLVAAQEAPHGTASVNILKRTGEPQFLASGFIYGWPENGTSVDHSIPDYFVTDIRFNANRAGGAQLPDPASGWAAGGYENYTGRFDSTLSNYRTTRKYGGDFIILPHDLWGSDGSLGDGLYPGDGGDWSQMEAFYDQLITDIKENDMLEGLIFDIWNEPDLEIFWVRSWEQFLEYYVRAHKILRKKLPRTLISGPSMAASPKLDDENWKAWMATVAKQKAIPDLYSWHQIGAWALEPDTTIPNFNTLRQQYGLPSRPIDINEYAWPDEQNPANSAWYFAQLERYNLRGLRAHWGGGSALHDFMANLVFKADGKYHPTGEWHMYKYYAEMTGQRLATKGSEDLLFDVYATAKGKTVKLLAGTRTVQAPYEIEVSGLTALCLPAKGSVHVRTIRFDWAGNEADTGAPADLGVKKLEYTKNKLSIIVDPPTNSTAYAYELIGRCS